jgi:hypothetical protein
MTAPEIHPTRDTADDLLRDTMSEIRKLAERFADNRVVVREKDKATFRALLERYRALQRQQGNANWAGAQENARD